MAGKNLDWNDGPKYSFKIIVLGSKGVGKSSLLKRFQFDEFENVPSHTIGVGLSTHNMKVGLASVQVVPVVSAKLYFKMCISFDELLTCFYFV